MAGMADASIPGRDLASLLDDLADRVRIFRRAVLLSRDGLLIAASSDLTRDDADHLSAVAAAVQSLAAGTGDRFAAGRVRQTIIELEHGILFVIAAGEGSCLAALCPADADAPAPSPTRWPCSSNGPGRILRRCRGSRRRPCRPSDIGARWRQMARAQLRPRGATVRRDRRSAPSPPTVRCSTSSPSSVATGLPAAPEPGRRHPSTGGFSPVRAADHGGRPRGRHRAAGGRGARADRRPDHARSRRRGAAATDRPTIREERAPGDTRWPPRTLTTPGRRSGRVQPRGSPTASSTGRRRARSLEGSLVPGTAVALVSGIPGGGGRDWRESCGKTQLAVALAQSLWQRARSTWSSG